MKKQILFMSLLIAMVVFPMVGFGQQWHELVEQMANGSVNWSAGVIEAKGIGAPPAHLAGKPSARPMAIRAAQLDAYRNLLEITKGVRVDSTTHVKDFVTQNDTIMTSVRGLVKGAQIFKTDYMADGTVEITMHMHLKGKLAQVILPKAIKPADDYKPPVQDIKPIDTTPEKPVDSTPPADTTPDEPEKEPEKPVKFESLSKVYTGLVVDARGLSAKPAMSPKVLDESGQEVYGSAYVSREFAVQQGMSGYAKDLGAAQSNERVTNTPLTVKGLKTDGPGRCDVVISTKDANLLRGASQNLSFLKKCRVMIVVD